MATQQNTKVKRSAQASNKTMLKKKNKKTPSPTTVAARKELVALSQQAKAVREGMIAQASTLEEALIASSTTINEILISFYEKDSGCKDFRTFWQWKDAGYRVKKGETAFRVWGAPRAINQTQDSKPADAPEGTISSDDLEAKSEFWPMCCLFNASQVEPLDRDTDSDDANAESNDGSEANTDALPEGWSEVATGGMATNPDPIRGGIIDSEIVGGKWFAIFNDEARNRLDGFASRADAFAAFSEALEVPGEQLEAEQEDQALEASESPFVATDYAARVDARRERIEDRAASARSKSQQLYSQAQKMASVIPFGQPILVGHHSERRDRRYREKFCAKFDKSHQLDKTADYYEQKAQTVGNAGIASDDPEALTKLKAKLAGLEQLQVRMKAANSALRRGDDAALATLGFTPAAIEELKKPDFCGRTGFPSFELTNNGAEIRRTKKRIEGLEALHASEAFEHRADDFDAYVSEGRVRFMFHGGKPSEDARQVMKRNSFKFSRNSGEWVRKATANATAAAPRVCAVLNALPAIY